MIKIVPFGDTALLVNFTQEISLVVHAQVTALARLARIMEGVRYVIPAYCSLTVVYDRTQTSFGTLQTQLAGVAENAPDALLYTSAREVRIPVCYDPPYAPDLEEVAHQTGKAPEEIINAHLSTAFHVYMLGFMPGFAYLGDMPEGFFCRRRAEPLRHVPAGSVGLAGLQTALYAFDTPGGWQIIGRTPVRLFDPAADPPNFLRAGDSVRFVRISAEELEERADAAPTP